MKVELRRTRIGKESTLSELYVDNTFVCYALEDAIRKKKIHGGTAIPAGIYRIFLNKYGAMNARYKRRFPRFHQGMLELQAVPHFSYIYIHVGNSIGDTSGCILVGEKYYVDADGDYVLEKSTKAYKRLYKMLLDSVQTQQCYIYIHSQIIGLVINS